MNHSLSQGGALPVSRLVEWGTVRSFASSARFMATTHLLPHDISTYLCASLALVSRVLVDTAEANGLFLWYGREPVGPFCRVNFVRVPFIAPNASHTAVPFTLQNSQVTHRPHVSLRLVRKRRYGTVLPYWLYDRNKQGKKSLLFTEYDG